ncbi:MAG TPA: cytochrome c oxidase assembly protein [Gaiellaceae bacterium]|nr:cytochrome c oxidase assembly protein [Gaiellaceae bacterium]
MSVPPLVVCAAAAALYALGGRGSVGGARGRRRLQALSYYGAVVVLFLALEPPLDDLADRSFAFHMLQHVFLLTVVPPLAILGRPWPRVWRPFPVGVRRSVARGLARGAWSAPLRRVSVGLARPAAAWALLAAAIGLWHVPSLYDAAVHNQGIHFAEHACFLVAALVYWGALLDAPPVRARIDFVRRAAWFAAGAVPGWILAIVLAFAGTPLYGAYLSADRPFGMSAYTDQQLSAGVMWVPGSIAFFVAFFISVYRWLEPDADDTPGEPRHEELSWT